MLLVDEIRRVVDSLESYDRGSHVESQPVEFARCDVGCSDRLALVHNAHEIDGSRCLKICPASLVARVGYVDFDIAVVDVDCCYAVRYCGRVSHQDCQSP